MNFLSKFYYNNDEVYEEEEEFSYGNYGASKGSYKKYDSHEGFLFCIELSEQMFREVPKLKYKVQLMEILESLLELLSQLVITRPSTGVGCYFYNCDNKDSKKRIYEFLPLVDINVRDMKKLHDLLDDIRTERISLREAFKYDETNNNDGNLMENLFLMIQDQFLRDIPGQKLYTNKKVFLFTDNDKPKESYDKEKIIRLRKLFDDISDNYIQFITFFINKENDEVFDNTFYSDILKLRNNDSIEFDGPSTKPISAAFIKTKILRKKEIKRIMFQCPLILDETSDFQVSVKGYTIVSHEKAGTKYKLVYEHENIRREAFSKKKLLNGKNGETVTKAQTEKIFQFGDLNLPITEEKFINIKEKYVSVEPFLKLIGFRQPGQSLHLYNNISKTLFVVPDESTCEGSIRTMTSLYKTMRNKDRNAILWGKLKVNSNPTIWVLAPSDPEKDPNEGFYLYRIPFLDEIRNIPTHVTYYKSEEVIDNQDYENLKRVTQNILGYFNLTHGYKPSEFRNPLLQGYYKLLHDYLLQVEIVPENEMTSEELKQKFLTEDDTIRKLAGIRDKIVESANSNENHKQRLSASFNIWNDIYSKLNIDDIATKDLKKPRN